jgi:flavorubredoxin
LQGKKLDYVVINHVEPDHCATLGELALRFPDVKIIVNARTFCMIRQFFDFDADKRGGFEKGD